MASTNGLTQLIKNISEDPILAGRLKRDCAAILDDYGLEDADRAILHSGDADAIGALIEKAAGRVDPAAILILSPGRA